MDGLMVSSKRSAGASAATASQHTQRASVLDPNVRAVAAESKPATTRARARTKARHRITRPRVGQCSGGLKVDRP